MKASEQDDAPRVRFDRPLEVKAMAIDGTWFRDSLLIDISDTGAEIEVTGHPAELTEFFLLLTSFGNPVFRRCKREWVHGARVGVSFYKSNIGMNSLGKVRPEPSWRYRAGNISIYWDAEHRRIDPIAYMSGRVNLTRFFQKRIAFAGGSSSASSFSFLA